MGDRFLLVVSEPLDDPRHGGAIDARGVYEALRGLGEVDVIVVAHRRLRDDQKRISEPANAIVVGRGSLLVGLVVHPRIPGQVSQRSTKRIVKSLRSQVATNYTAGCAITSYGARLLDQVLPPHTPRWIRSQNFEADYFRLLAQSSASSFRRIYYRTEAHRFRSWELEEFQRESWLMYCVTLEDCQKYKSLGIQSKYMPPILDPLVRSKSSHTKRHHRNRVLWTGNLFMPNNLAGLRWFLEQIWPKVLKSHNGAKLHVVGSRPDQEILRLLSEAPNAEVATDVNDIGDYYSRATVCINPALHIAGIQMKSLMALTHGVPLVTTTQGAVGVPTGPFLDVVTTADQFAEAICHRLDDTDGDENLLNSWAEASQMYSVVSAQQVFRSSLLTRYT